MLKACLTGLTVLMLSAGLTVAAPATSEQTYDLLCRVGTLCSVDRESE